MIIEKLLEDRTLSPSARKAAIRFINVVLSSAVRNEVYHQSVGDGGLFLFLVRDLPEMDLVVYVRPDGRVMNPDFEESALEDGVNDEKPEEEMTNDTEGDSPGVESKDEVEGQGK